MRGLALLQGVIVSRRHLLTAINGDSDVTLQHQGCFARLSLQLAFLIVSTALATRFSSISQRKYSTSPAF